MMSLFKKKLVTDTSGEEIRRVTTNLEKFRIKYEIRTARPRGLIGSALDAQTYARANLAIYKGAPDPIFVYTVYVGRRDYQHARAKLYGN